MEYNNTITIATIDLNNIDFENLFRKTNFDISDIIWDVLRDNPKRRFTIDNVNFAIDPPMFMSINDCNGDFSLFVSTDDKEMIMRAESDTILQQLIHDRISNIVSDVKERLNKIKIPTTQLKFITYFNTKFYVEIGHDQPDTLTLDCDFNQTIEDLYWT